MKVADQRAWVLTHLVGQSRAYLRQLDETRAELMELRTSDLDLVLKAVEGATVVVAAVDSIATEKLRDT